ncbi:MAG: tRNA (N6-threonylcarbamoyladenosine(37)-N6)-methyltransferase TrmO [Anaerolineales bacterium]|nr:tRNA (N6-threonylcarbamoyladenosine(37)-N6)-methyltransferase TrmO [Anaerolineales bacterium]
MPEFESIGIIHSPFRDPSNMPIQPGGNSSKRGYADINPAYAEGLKDLDGFSHLILLYHFHRTTQVRLTVTPFLDREPRGVFSTRAPTRPNPIGLSIVRLESIDGCRLHLLNLDILDGTPLLDIKPYVPAFDHQEGVRIGWLAPSTDEVSDAHSDDRFV